MSVKAEILATKIAKIIIVLNIEVLSQIQLY